MNLLKRVIIMTLFIFLILPVFSSRLRVLQLGSDWLVPDKYVDIITNPSAINNINRNFVFNNTYIHYRVQENVSSVSSINKKIYSNIDLASFHDFELINMGLMLSGAYSSEYIDSATRYENYYYWKSGIYKVSFFTGIDLTENISSGVKLEAAIDNPFYSHSMHEVSLGFNIKNDSGGWGVVFDAADNLKNFTNYRYNISLLAEHKLNENNFIRGINALAYSEEETVYDSPPGYIENQFMGTQELLNKTGVSLILLKDDVTYVAEIINEWTINYTQKTYNMPEDTISLTGRVSDNISARLGIEMPLLTDWIKLRFKSNIFNFLYKKTKDEEKDNTDSVVSPYSKTSYQAAFFLFLFDDSFAGVGINISEDLLLDINLYNLFDDYNAHLKNEDYYTTTFHLFCNITYKY